MTRAADTPLPFMEEVPAHRSHGLRFRCIEGQETADFAALSRTRRLVAAIDGTHEPLDQRTTAIILRSTESLAVAWGLLARGGLEFLVSDRDRRSWLIGPCSGGTELVAIAVAPGMDLSAGIALRDLIIDHGPVAITAWTGASQHAFVSDFPELLPSDELAARAQSALRAGGVFAFAMADRGEVSVYLDDMGDPSVEWIRTVVEILAGHGIRAERHPHEDCCVIVWGDENTATPAP